MLTAICCVFASCKDDTKLLAPQPIISITVLESAASTDKITVKFEANETTSRYSYAIGTAADEAIFLEGNMPGTHNVSGNAPTEFTFDALNVATEYVVFAIGYDSKGKPGALSKVIASTDADSFIVTQRYVSDVSAGFRIKCSDDFYQYKYYIGTADDKEAFLNDEIEDMVLVSETFDWTENRFDLTPDTEYVFYVVGYQRTDAETRLFEIPFKTAKSDEIPNVTIEMGVKDFYTQNYTITPNAKCKKIVMSHKRSRDYDPFIYGKNNWAGDLMTMYHAWSGYPEAEITEMTRTYSATDKVLNATTFIPEFGLDESLDIYVLIYGEDYQPFCVKKMLTKSPSLNPNLGKAKASDFDVTINSVNGTTQTIDFTVKYSGQDMSGFLFDIIDKEYLDKEMAKPGFDPYFLHNTLYAAISTGTTFVYKETDFTTATTDKALKINKEYYIGICPMNANGPVAGGWGEMVLKEFNTNVTPE